MFDHSNKRLHDMYKQGRFDERQEILEYIKDRIERQHEARTILDGLKNDLEHKKYE